MSQFFEKWKSFKDDVKLEKSTQLLNEFTKKDKQELLSQGGDFTVSYEIEMISRDEIDDQGNIGSNTAGYTDVAGMSSRRQVDFFGMADSIYENVSDEAADDADFYINLYDTEGTTYSLNDFPLAIIAAAKLYKEEGEVKSYRETTLKECDIESFLIASYLTQHEDINNFLANSGNTPESRKAITDKIQQFNLKEGGEVPIALLMNPNISADEFSNEVGRLLGMEGDDWDLSFEEADFNRLLLFQYLTGRDIELEQVNKINNVCKYLLRNRTYPTLREIVDTKDRRRTEEVKWNQEKREHETVKTPYVEFMDFAEFNTALVSLSGRAAEYIESRTEAMYDNFDYQDYGIDLEANNAYDSNRDIYPDQDYSGGNALDTYLPNFWGKYGSDMDADSDASLPTNHGIEIKMTKYLDGLNEAMRYLDLFFQDFDKQDNFSFSQATGLHTNLSMNVPDKRFDVFKALMFLSEEETPGKEGKAPYAYRGIESRYKEQAWSKPLKNAALKNIKEQFAKLPPNDLERVKQYYRDNDFDSLSKYLSSLVKSFGDTLYVKRYGFNVQYTDTRGYIEFRYPGHVLQKEDLQDLTLYYAYIVKLCLDPNYKREEYINKMIGFLQDSLFSIPKTTQISHMLQDYKTFTTLAKKYEDSHKLATTNDVENRVAEFNRKFIRELFQSIRNKYELWGQIRDYQDMFDQSRDIKTGTDIIDLDPSLKEKIIQKFAAYRNIPAYLYSVKFLEKVKNLDGRIFGAHLVNLEYILNGLYSDLDKKNQEKFYGDPYTLHRVFTEISKELKDSFAKYFEANPDKFDFKIPPPAPPAPEVRGIQSESVFDKYESMLDELYEGRKLGKPSSETNLGDWFKRKGAPGKKGGWVDCNTCRDGKCKPCGRQEGEKRGKYPRCRPTPSQCKGYKRRGSNLQKEE